jgi:hypothetical protein
MAVTPFGPVRPFIKIRSLLRDQRYAALSWQAKLTYLSLCLLAANLGKDGTLAIHYRDRLKPLNLDEICHSTSLSPLEQRRAIRELLKARLARHSASGVLIVNEHFSRVNVRPGISPKLRAAVLARDGGTCVLCNSSGHLEIDHIVAVASGGPTALDNLQALCRACNRRKGPKAYATRHLDAA